MKLNAYSVYDVKALVYRVPFFAVNHAVAIRTLEQAVNDPGTLLHQHPADFKLYCVGIYDDATGAMVAMSPHEYVRDAVSLVKIDSQADMFSGLRVVDPKPNGAAYGEAK